MTSNSTIIKLILCFLSVSCADIAHEKQDSLPGDSDSDSINNSTRGTDTISHLGTDSETDPQLDSNPSLDTADGGGDETDSDSIEEPGSETEIDSNSADTETDYGLKHSWSPWTTDGALPVDCGTNSLVSGARCKGSYCDDISLRCTTGAWSRKDSRWSDDFSEEGSHEAVCDADGFVTGIRCTGSYCDKVSIQCSKYENFTRDGKCYWSGKVSEESGGSYVFPKSMYLAGIRCSGKYCDEKAFYLCEGPQSIGNFDANELPIHRAPILRFDSQFGSDNGADSKCLPSDAGDYYNQRQSGLDPLNLCNKDYDGSIHNSSVPVYYVAEKCGENLVVIRYWIFYAWQSACLTLAGQKIGSHAADWESVLVRVENGDMTTSTFYQHGGWYTKKAGTFESEATHPIAYVGKNSHGSYHDSGGSGGCLYFSDYRDPGSENMRMDTGNNLVYLHAGDDAPEWMRCRGSDCFDGIGHPIEQTGTLCATVGCNKDGCEKSDIGKIAY